MARGDSGRRAARLTLRSLKDDFDDLMAQLDREQAERETENRRHDRLFERVTTSLYGMPIRDVEES